MRLSVIVVGLCLGAPATAWAAERPAPLPDEDNCRHYRGTCSGNDPSVRLDVILCPHSDGGNGRVAGKLQWSSTLSGWNLRRIEGSWSGSTLTFRDTKIIEEKPANGYYFCIIDPYVLEEDASGTLTGRYKSAACNDDASITLEPVVAPGGGTNDEPVTKREATTPHETPTTAPETAPAKPEPSNAAPSSGPDEQTATSSTKGGCGCAPSLLAMFPLVVARRRRRSWAVRATPLRPQVGGLDHASNS